MATVAEKVVDAAIGWLVQSILKNLFSEKLQAWTRGVGLGDDVEKLMSDMRYVEMVVAAAKGKKIEDEALAQSLVDLKQLLYDAEDVMDELDYYRLQEQVTSGNDTNIGVRSTGTPSTWSFPQIGSTLMGNVGSLICAGISFGKRKREDVHSAGTSTEKRKTEDDRKNIASDVHLANMSVRIKDIAGRLRHLGTDVAGILQIHVSKFYDISDLSQSTPSDARVTISHLSESKVYGRDTELEFILKQIPSPQEKGKQDLIAHSKPFTRREKMSSSKCGGITVVPIVGVGGVGKTTLAQLVYNDPKVGSRFDIKMWLCVTDKFDLLRLTREMLGYVDDQRQAQTCNLDKLQKDLFEQMKSKRFLIVLDDVWNSMTKHRWDKLLAPLKHDKSTDSMILVTTRESSVAEMTQTVEPVKLGPLEENDFWLLFKSCVYGDEESEEHPNLHIIGKQIALELRGNPLAAKTVGALLGSNISMASWTNIRDNEEWKSLQYSNGIMPALKLSYDYLPDHLQQCFRYCCLFPKGYHFDGAELVRIWISQGFVHHSNTGKTVPLEDTGKVYLADLVKSGFFQQVERDWSSLDFMRGGDTDGLFGLHDLMHDLAWEVSRADFAIINGSDCEDIRTTTRHLSIVIDSAYHGNDPRGNTFTQENFDEKMKKVTSAVKKLRSLVLIGYYDPPFFEDFNEMFKQAENLRLLQISATYTDFVHFLRNLEHHAHLRYLKLENRRNVLDLSIPLGKFYHLQVLDVGRPTIPSSMMKDLVRMRYLVLKKATHVTCPYYNGFEMLQSMNDLVHLGVYQLKNVSIAEADGAKLRDKRHLETLHLSWKDALLQDGYDNDTSSEHYRDTSSEHYSDTSSENNSDSSPEDYCNTSSETHSNSSPEDYGNTSSENNSNSSPEDYGNIRCENRSNSSPEDYDNTSSEHYRNTISGHYVGTEPEDDNWPINGSNNILTSEQCTDTAEEVLEGLEPHRNLKHLRISGYSGATSPNWFSSVVLYTCLQTLHLEDCGEWQALPSLERLPFLTKLKLRNMSKVTQVSIPPLEELMLIKMAKLERCSCNSLRDLNSSLRVLMIVRCDVLKAFPLFDSCEKFRIEQKSWLPGLNNLTIHDCPLLIVSKPLTPSSRACKLSIIRVSRLPSMEGSSNSELIIGADVEDKRFFDEDSDGLRKLDEKVLSFHNLTVLTRLRIKGFKNLLFVSLEGFKQLISLKSLEIWHCTELFSSDVLPEQVHGDIATTNFNAFPALKRLSIVNSRISGKWLSVMLRNALVLEELDLDCCGEISGLLIEGKESCLSNHNSSPQASSPGNLNDASTSSTSEGLMHIPSIPISSLKKLSIVDCYKLTFIEKEASFSPFTSLEELKICGCPELISSFGHKDKNSDHTNGGCLRPYSPSEPDIVELESLQKLQLCPQMSLNCLKKLEISSNMDLESLKLDSYTTLEELIIDDFDSLTSLEGLQSLRGLRCLSVYRCPWLPPFLERLSGQISELFPRLERLGIGDYFFLTTSFCMHLTSLRCLELCTWYNEVEGLTGELDRALQLITSLQDLKFYRCYGLVDLPVGLHSLSSLKRLRIIECWRILKLPEKGLPPSLEELEIEFCSKKLTRKCRLLATSMLKVKIDWDYVN